MLQRSMTASEGREKHRGALPMVAFMLGTAAITVMSVLARIALEEFLFQPAKEGSIVPQGFLGS
ncbi:hypothetical protein [Belnapia rosea]|nr:hypothetical protein [Belnapia rosea]